MAEARAIRVFISSTFRDMVAERDELATHAWPALRALCEERAVTFTDVDLRWGITDEQVAEGEVLPRCLAEIDASRPFFIGILGERYGSRPDAMPGGLLRAEPWLAGQEDRSVTELEIVHGVLNDPEMAGRALFYFRDPAYAETLPESVHADFAAEDAESAHKLAGLKERIRNSGLPVREGFEGPAQLVSWVREDLERVIDETYPADEAPDTLARERLAHEAYAASRRGVYIGRKEYDTSLEAHASGTGPPLLVTGESGGGKSALLANWVHAYRCAHPDEVVVEHYVGASTVSADWSAMCTRIAGELSAATGVEVDLPTDPAELRTEFKVALGRFAAARRVVVVIDGLNQLEDRDGAPDLAWLPPVVPEGVRLVCSTLPGRALDEARRRGWAELTVEPLTRQEREKLITEYLASFAKSLDPALAQSVATAPQSSSPLFVRVLIDELRVAADYAGLPAILADYLEADSVEDLYGLVLERWESDYERERPGLVGDTTTALWAARRGLSESELLSILGEEGSPLPRALFSPLYFAARPSLVSRAGLLGFAHDFLRQAVERRYVSSKEAKRAAHVRLAEHFAGQDRLGVRTLDERPWQLMQAEEWDELKGLLSDLRVLGALWALDAEAAVRYWAALKHNGHEAPDSYADVLASPQDYERSDLAGLVRLLRSQGYFGEVARLGDWLAEACRHAGDQDNLLQCMLDQAWALRNTGDFAGVMQMLREQASICREREDPSGLSRSLGNQAVLLLDSGQQLSRVAELLAEQATLCRESGDMLSLQQYMGTLGGLRFRQGHLAEAIELFREQERICRERGDSGGLGNCLHRQARVLVEQGDLRGAQVLAQEAVSLARALGDMGSLSAFLETFAASTYMLGDVDGALRLCEERVELCREELSYTTDLPGSLAALARVLVRIGEYGRAAQILENVVGAARESGCLEFVARELETHAKEVAKLDTAGEMLFLSAQERVCHELRDEGAAALNKKQGRTCHELSDLAGLQATLGRQALILHTRGDLDGAMALHKEQERICHELGHPAGLPWCLGSQATILRDRGDFDGAMALHKQEERMCRELDDPAGLQTSLGNQGLILHTGGDLDGAMALFKEQERICRQFKLAGALQCCLDFQTRIRRARSVKGKTRWFRR